MDIGQLKTLIHVAELGSLSKASARLNIVQPALSRKIRLLEEELDVVLFDRDGRGMVPTTMGGKIIDHAIKVMGELEDIRRLAASRTEKLAGEVVIGVTPTVAEFATVPLAQRTAAEHPDLAVRFTSAFSGYLLDWLQSGDIDVALSYDPERVASLRVRPVMIENLLLIRHNQCVDDGETGIAFSRLAGERLVLPSQRHGLRKILDACALRAGITLKPSVEADSLNAIVALVRNGFGSTILPLPPVYDAVLEGRLQAVPIFDPAPTRTLVIASACDRGMTDAAQFIANAFIDVANEFVSRRGWAGTMLA